jgi:competence protein ComEC
MPRPVPDYSNLDGRQIIVEGEVYRKGYKERTGLGEVPVLYLKSVHILMDSEYSERNPSKQFPKEEIENIFCYMEQEGYQEPALGTTLRLKGELRSFARAGNPGEFDMQSYYRMMKLAFRLDNAHIQASGGKAWYVRERMYRLKEYFAKTLEKIFPTKEASIMKAMLLGEKDGLDGETKKLYRQSSIIHILSISGLHISMIGMGLYRILRKAGLGLWSAAWISIAVISGYGIMTGLSMSSVRAIIMFSLHLMADMMGRTYDMATALALAAALLLAGEPDYAGNSGFLFSFGAVASLGALAPVLHNGELDSNPRTAAEGSMSLPRPGTGGESCKKDSFLQGKKGFRDGRGKETGERAGARVWNAAAWKIKQAVISGFAVTLGTLPIHLWFYFQFPVYSILLNLAVIPLMAVVMGFGLVCMIGGGFASGMARWAALVPRAVLWFYEKCCLLGEKIPYGTLVNGRPEGWQVFVYLFLMVLLVFYGHGEGKRLPLFWKCQWIFASLCILLLKMDGGFQVTMLDVGQGDCIYIRSGEGKHYLIDAGSSTKKDMMEYQVIPYLKFMGVEHLEAIFVTHFDSDHCGGVFDLLEEYPMQGLTIGSLILPDIGRESADNSYEEMEKLAGEKRVKVQYMSRGQRIKDKEMSFTCMHPDTGYETGEKNEYSLVLLLTYQEFKGLFTGDVEGSGEVMAWEYMRGSGKADELTVLKVAHHGSGNSTGMEMLDILSPRIALISCGKNNRYGHPHEDLLKRLDTVGSRIYTTPEYGAVTVGMEGRKIWVDSFRKEGCR